MNALLGALALAMLLVVVVAITNIRHKKSNEEYNEYLLELDEIKKRKRNRDL